MRIYAIEEGTGRRRLVRIECDKDGCDAVLVPGPGVLNSGWTLGGYRDGKEKYWFDRCPDHEPLARPSPLPRPWERAYERKYHCAWLRVQGFSPLYQIGKWLHDHPGQLAEAPRDLLTSALANVSDRLPKVAAREPTRRHRKHFAWLLGWHMRLVEAIA